MCAAVNFDFILIVINFDFILCNSNVDFMLYYNLLLCFIQLEMHVRLICAIKFYLLTCLLKHNVTVCMHLQSNFAYMRPYQKGDLCVSTLTKLIWRNITFLIFAVLVM